MMTVSVFAPAKINLSLHVSGQTEGGFHLLDSLVGFASFGDEVIVEDGKVLSLTVEGAESKGIPDGPENLAFRAADLLGHETSAKLTLKKRLPSASGIGGGSADAAAAFRAMLVFGQRGQMPVNKIWSMSDKLFATHARALLDLGADVPMCLLSRPVRARGVGEQLSFFSLPPLPAVLVNPRVPLATPDVFRALSKKTNPPMPEQLPRFKDADMVVGFLEDTRNDLHEPAASIAPQIDAVLSEIRSTPGCRLARMSGSGATCFGLYSNQADAGTAATALRDLRPDWWIVDCWIGDQSAAAMPRGLS